MRHMTPLVIFALLAASCGNGKSHIEGDSDIDTAVDTGSDGTVDSSTDLQADDLEDASEGDASADPAVDTSPDTAADPTDDPAGEDAIDPASYGVVGDPCTTSEDCLGVPGFPNCLTIVPGWSGYTEYPNGYCSGDCIDDGDCGEGAGCASLGGAGRFCLKMCETNADCREAEGYVCRNRHSDPTYYCQLPRPPRPDAEEDAPPDGPPGDAPDDVPADVPDEAMDGDAMDSDPA